VRRPSLRISPYSFDKLAEFITRELGIKMPDSKVSMIQSRLVRRVRDLGLQSIDEYYDHLFFPTRMMRNASSSSTPLLPTKRISFASLNTSNT
jgi:hypothetical protein